MDNSIKVTFPNSEKVYLHGKQNPDVKVGMRKVTLTPTVDIVNGEKKVTPNAPVYIYDTSGPYGDANMQIDLKKGLPRLREQWITNRGDVERLPEISSKYGRQRRDDHNLDSLRFDHIALPFRKRRIVVIPCIQDVIRIRVIESVGGKNGAAPER